jgi:hypothetical protein
LTKELKFLQRRITGAWYDLFYPSTTREESQMANFHTTLFQNSFVLIALKLQIGNDDDKNESKYQKYIY